MSLLDGLISWWGLDELSGTRYDAFGTNHLSDHNTVGSATGKVNKAADFEVSNSEYLYRASNASLQFGDEDFTIACWVKLESFSDGYRFFVTKANNLTPEYSLDAVYPNFRFYVRNSSGTLTPIAKSGATTGVWHYLVGWHSASANKVYLQLNNGTPVSASHSGGCNAGSNAFLIGSYVDNGGALYMDGLIDEVALWRRVLTTEERSALYNGGAGLSFSDLFPKAMSVVWL